MPDHVYVVVYDQLDPSFDPIAIRDALRSDKRIAHWWNHIPNCFLVDTNRSAADLSDWLKRYTREVGFFVMETDPAKSDGYLPSRSWEWILRREQERSTEAV